MKKGIVYFSIPKRVIDYITDAALKLGLIKSDGFYPVISDTTGEKIGGLECVRGNGLVVRFLEWATQYRGKDYKEVEIEYI